MSGSRLDRARYEELVMTEFEKKQDEKRKMVGRLRERIKRTCNISALSGAIFLIISSFHA